MLVSDVGTYVPLGDVRDGVFEERGIFYTDVSRDEAPSLWFMPSVALPGAT